MPYYQEGKDESFLKVFSFRYIIPGRGTPSIFKSLPSLWKCPQRREDNCPLKDFPLRGGETHSPNSLASAGDEGFSETTLSGREALQPFHGEKPARTESMSNPSPTT